MLKARILVVSLLAFCLAIGPVASALANSAGTPCESMGTSMPPDGCCDAGMERASCLSGCLAASPAMAALASHLVLAVLEHAVVGTPAARRASILAPPDIAPPKSPVS